MSETRPQVRRVLVVDDEEATLELLRNFLQGSGIEVQTAQSVDEAIGLARRQSFDAFLVDKNLPDEEHGIDLIRRLLELDSGAVVLVMTAHGSPDSVYDVVRVGAAGYLLKPFRNGLEVTRAVQDAVARSAMRHRAVEKLRSARRATGRVRTITDMGEEAPVDLGQVQIGLLVVSTDANVQKRAHELQALSRWKLRVAISFTDAIAALKEPPIDAVLCDGTLGDQALRLLARARTENPAAGILFIGSSMTFASSRELVGLGAIAQTPTLPGEAQRLGELVVRACSRARTSRKAAR